MAIKKANNLLEGTDIENITNNPKYEEFGGFRKLETHKRNQKLKEKIGQSEKAVIPMAYLNSGTTLMYSNLSGKNPVERRSAIADKAVEQYHQKLKQKILSYRNMLKSPEVSDILDNVVNEAITDNGRGKIISLAINDEYPGIAIGDGTKINLQQDFNNVMQTIFEFNQIASESFKKFLVEGSQFWEVVYNKEKNKIIGVNQLPSYNMLVIVDKGEIVGYRQIIDNEYGGLDPEMQKKARNGVYQYIDYHVNQILWLNYGAYGPDGINDRMSYLEPAKKFVNTLENMENAYAKYIIMRGQEKRVVYVSTGKMPPTKAEEHLQRVSTALNRKFYFDPSEGNIIGAERIQAMCEDIFIPLPDGQQPSRIEQLPAGANVGEVTPLNYFREKIYQALKYPRSRSRMNTQSAQPYSIGKPGEIDVEQVTLTKFIESLQQKFGSILIDLFIMYLETRTEYDDKIKDKKLYRVVFEQSNVFKLIKESEMINLRMDLLAKIQPFISDHSGGPNDIFAKEFVLKEYVGMSDDEYSRNEQLKDKEFVKRLREKERLDELNRQSGNLNDHEGEPEGMDSFGGGSSDFGGGFGGGELGGGSEAAPAGEPSGEAPVPEIPSEENPE